MNLEPLVLHPIGSAWDDEVGLIIQDHNHSEGKKILWSCQDTRLQAGAEEGGGFGRTEANDLLPQREREVENTPSERLKRH